MTTGTIHRGMIPVGTMTIAFIKADHINGVPTAIIYGASEGVDAPQALRDFCSAYSTSKGAVAIVQAFSVASSDREAVGKDAGLCDTVGCGRDWGHGGAHTKSVLVADALDGRPGQDDLAHISPPHLS